MLNDQELQYLRAVAAMSNRPGSYVHLVEGYDGWCYLSHKPVGRILYTFPPSP